MSMSLVSTVTVGSGEAASIEFTSIPQDGTDLLVLISLRGSTTSTAAKIEFNNSTSNLSYLFLQGDGAAAASALNESIIAVGGIARSTSTANTFGNGSIYVSNYTSSSAKSISGDGVGENNETTAHQRLAAGLWNDTSAITSLKIVGFANFVEFSSASLYKITKGSDGIVTTS